MASNRGAITGIPRWTYSSSFTGKHVVRGNIAPVGNKPHGRALNHLRDRLHAKHLLAEVNPVFHAGSFDLRLKLLARIAVAEDLEAARRDTSREPCEMRARQVQSQAPGDGAVIDDPESLVRTWTPDASLRKTSGSGTLGSTVILSMRRAAPAEHIPVRIMNADHLVRQPDAELFLEGQEADQRMLLGDAELGHVQFRHHVVDVQHDPARQRAWGSAPTSTSRSGMVCT